MTRPLDGRRRAVAALAVVACAGAAVAGGAALRPHGPAATAAGPAPGPARYGDTAEPAGGADALGADIARLQQLLRAAPGDATSWATLGVDYVQAARDTAQPMYYPKAAGALRQSRRLGGPDDVAALVGTANLRAAQHRFADALRWARRAAAADPYSAAAQGALADAFTQLGRYADAARAVQRMVDLRPTTASLARASYVYELRGRVPAARALMHRALRDATTPAQQAFTYHHLGQLAFDAGRPRAALALYERALQADPAYPDPLAGRARAEAALARRTTAVRDYAAVLARVPQPSYAIEAGRYLESIGRTRQAAAAYRLFTVENRLFAANGVRLDADPALFYADRGDGATALRYARAGIRTRPFLDMDDAYAWALHAAHRDREALRWSRRAMGTGMRSALFAFHAGMIERSIGETAAARRHLAAALRLNPYFDPLLAPAARRALAELGGRS